MPSLKGSNYWREQWWNPQVSLHSVGKKAKKYDDWLSVFVQLRLQIEPMRFPFCFQRNTVGKERYALLLRYSNSKTKHCCKVDVMKRKGNGFDILRWMENKTWQQKLLEISAGSRITLVSLILIDLQLTHLYFGRFNVFEQPINISFFRIWDSIIANNRVSKYKNLSAIAWISQGFWISEKPCMKK